MRISEEICLVLNGFFPKKKVKGRASAEAYSAAQYEWARKALELYAPYIDLKDKDMLDAGCGPGGKTIFFSEQGVKSIIGIDIDPERIALAKQFATQKGATLPQFLVASLEELPFESDRFDVIFLNDVVEHIERPILLKALSECKRVLKPGGKICLEFPPWTAIDAAHLYDYIHIPWCQVFFSDKTLLNVLNKLAPAASTIGSADYAQHYRELNKITYAQFKQYVKDLGFKPVVINLVMPFKIQGLKYVPFFNKYLARRVMAVLSK